MTQKKPTRARTRPKPSGIESLVHVSRPKTKWSDLVVPDAVNRNLQQIVTRANSGVTARSGGGVAFMGVDTAGMTLAAEVVASTLGRPLHRVDLSAVVSKYIGETEKNLRRLFDAAEAGEAILFFDEADALFGKRTSVKDSHDRYANLEVNFLLQRLEAFHGLAILATNRKQNIDQAFLRRLRFIVEFPARPLPPRKVVRKTAKPVSRRK